MSHSSLQIFQPVTGTNKSEAIASQIEAAIATEQLASGERLPSERSLQQLFETSRGAVREALRLLRQKGVVEARKGAQGGHFIKKVNINDAIDHLAGMIQQQQMPFGKVLEFQYAMDQAVLISAITHGTEDEISTLFRLAEELTELCHLPEPEFSQISTVDKKLNLIMVQMTRNPFFEWMMRTVQLAFRAYEFVLYEDDFIRPQIALNWKNTAQAVKNRDVQKALGLYGHWYAMLEQCLTEKFGAACFAGTPGVQYQ